MVFFNNLNVKKVYKILIVSILLIPNVFVAISGIESFPYTCAPMFSHYIGEKTELYVFEFEGINDGSITELSNYYGKTELYFIRHFFSKAYGSIENISPFSNRLSDDRENFSLRMNEFFFNFNEMLKIKHKTSFNRINLNVIRVDKNRNQLALPCTIGFYEIDSQQYYPIYNDK